MSSQNITVPIAETLSEGSYLYSVWPLDGVQDRFFFFEYKKTGSGTWIPTETVKAEVYSGKTLYESITSLDAGTGYDFRAVYQDMSSVSYEEDFEGGTEVTESEVIEINNNFLWLKYTLETTDDKVTPTLEEVYLQDATYYYYGDTETFTTEGASVGEDTTVTAVTASIIFEGAAISVQAAQEVLVDVVLGSMDFDPLVPNIVTTKDNHVTDIPPPITEFESLEPSISTTIGAPVLTASQIDDYIYVEWEVG